MIAASAAVGMNLKKGVQTVRASKTTNVVNTPAKEE